MKTKNTLDELVVNQEMNKFNDEKKSAFHSSSQENKDTPRTKLILQENTNEFENEKNMTFEVPEFKSNVNYHLEYWEIFKKNEIVLAKIKEASTEIEYMKSHLSILEKAQKNS